MKEAENKKEKYNKAIEAYNKAIELNPDLAEVHCNPGISKDKLGQYPEAIIEKNGRSLMTWFINYLKVRLKKKLKSRKSVFKKQGKEFQKVNELKK